jgi:hypothetical protein
MTRTVRTETVTITKRKISRDELETVLCKYFANLQARTIFTYDISYDRFLDSITMEETDSFIKEQPIEADIEV